MPGIIGMPGMPMQQPPHGPQPQQPAKAKEINKEIQTSIYVYMYMGVCVRVSVDMHVLLLAHTSM